jgi:hypothetical protein
MCLIRLSLGGYTLQEYLDDDFHEHWRPLDWLPNHFKARGLLCYTYHLNFSRRKIQNQGWPSAEPTTQPKDRGLLHMECDFAIALPYNLDFKTYELDHLPASRQFKYYWRLLQAVLEDAQELLEEASRLLELQLSTPTCSGAYWAYTRVPIQGRMKTNSYWNSPIILLGLVLCN